MELVAQGLTNPQIADRMFISRATVKVQVAFIFQKLDISDRAELTAKAVRREAQATISVPTVVGPARRSGI